MGNGSLLALLAEGGYRGVASWGAQTPLASASQGGIFQRYRVTAAAKLELASLKRRCF